MKSVPGFVKDHRLWSVDCVVSNLKTSIRGQEVHVHHLFVRQYNIHTQRRFAKGLKNYRNSSATIRG
jgi:hypothetical protein